MLINLLVVTIVLIAMLRAGDDYDRSMPCIIVFVSSLTSYTMYYYGDYNGFSDYMGYYAYQSVYPLISILILKHISGKLAFCLMGLFSFQIIFNLLAFSIEGAGYYIDYPYQFTQWALYVVEITLLFSRRFTDGIYRNLLRYGVAGNTTADCGYSSNIRHGVENSAGEVKE